MIRQYQTDPMAGPIQALPVVKNKFRMSLSREATLPDRQWRIMVEGLNEEGPGRAKVAPWVIREADLVRLEASREDVNAHQPERICTCLKEGAVSCVYPQSRSMAGQVESH